MALPPGIRAHTALPAELAAPTLTHAALPAEPVALVFAPPPADGAGGPAPRRPHRRTDRAPAPRPTAAYTTVDTSVPWPVARAAGVSPRDYALTLRASGASERQAAAAVGTSSTSVGRWARGTPLRKERAAYPRDASGDGPLSVWRGYAGKHDRIKAAGVPTSDFAPVQAGSTRELVGKLADQALRLLERQMHDRDPRIASDAAMRVSNFVRSTDALPAAPAQTPEEVRAAIRAGLESAEGCALVVDVAETIGPLKSALCTAGWTPPG